MRTDECGITHTVRTYPSSLTVSDIISHISREKTEALLSWLALRNVQPKKILILGAYLTGAEIAVELRKTGMVTVLDIHSEVRVLLPDNIRFTIDLSEVLSERWDMIIDTTGLGGIDAGTLSSFEQPEIFLTEDPTSDVRDSCIQEKNRSGERIKAVHAPLDGRLMTRGLLTKTSGTMTLTMAVLTRSILDAQEEEGVLYSSASMEFYERILFHEKKPEEFLILLNRPALFISSLREISGDRILKKNLTSLHCEVISRP